MIQVENLTTKQLAHIKPYRFLNKQIGGSKVVGISRFIGKRKETLYLCICECGNLFESKVNRIQNSPYLCCDACVSKRNKRSTKHGLIKHPLYIVWSSMKDRCYLKSVKQYKNYGGRGIQICDEWRYNFKSFYEWAIKNGWKHGLTIDRIDNNKGYDPTNCKFSTMKEQQNNKRNNHLITYKGQTKNITQWCEELGLNRNSVYWYINYKNKSLEQIMEEKQNGKSNNRTTNSKKLA